MEELFQSVSIDQKRSSANWPLAKILQRYINHVTRRLVLSRSCLGPGSCWCTGSRKIHFNRYPQNFVILKTLCGIIGAGRDQRAQIRFLYLKEIFRITWYEAFSLYKQVLKMRILIIPGFPLCVHQHEPGPNQLVVDKVADTVEC